MTPSVVCTSEDGLGVRLVDDESDCCSGGSSLDDTLLTCDESLSSDSEVAYNSPENLRRRLLPLAPSPIIETVYAASSSPQFRDQQKTKGKWRSRPYIRVLLLSLSLMLYQVFTLADFRWIMESMAEVGLSQEARQWNRYFRKAPKILQKIQSTTRSAQYTIRIKGQRLDLISQSLDYHAQCPSVRSVQVESDSILLKNKSEKVEMVQKPKTQAVLLLDEGTLLSCEELERAFREWKIEPSRLVGFYPYHHKDAKLHQESSSSLRNKPRFRPVSRGEGAYSMLSDRAVFVHNLYLRSLPSVPHHCQQFGLSMVVSSLTSKPPIAVMSNPQTVRQAKQSLHMAEEDNRQCQQWMDSIIALKLPEHAFTFVGH